MASWGLSEYSTNSHSLTCYAKWKFMNRNLDKWMMQLVLFVKFSTSLTENSSHLEIQPVCFLSKVPSYSKKTLFKVGVPIISVSAGLRRNGMNYVWKQLSRQLPYAVTDHKSQSLILDQAMVDIRSNVMWNNDIWVVWELRTVSL